MTQLQIFDNPEFGNVRVVIVDGEPQFCLSDVCKILDLRVAKVVERLDKDVLSTHPLETAGGVQSMYCVNEDGLYDTILDSRKPEAKRFRKWITSEVLPSIRKTGMYVNPAAQITPDLLRNIADAIEQRDKQITVLTTQVAELTPKASYYDTILNCRDVVSVSKIAKDYGMSAKSFNRLLKDLGVQFNQGGVWLPYQKYAKQGWTQSKTHSYLADGDTHCRVHTYWTQKGRLGLYDLLKAHGYLPTVEWDV